MRATACGCANTSAAALMRRHGTPTVLSLVKPDFGGILGERCRDIAIDEVAIPCALCAGGC
jgi:hypothetical protein